MKILVSNIKYKEKTQEWSINIDSLASYKQYMDNPAADHSLWHFGDFMTFNNQLPTCLELEIPFASLVDDLDNIEQYITGQLKTKTSRDIDSFVITELE